MVFANKCIQNYFQNFFFLIELGLCCRAWAFSRRGERKPLSGCGAQALSVVTSVVAEHRLRVPGLSCPTASWELP